MTSSDFNLQTLNTREFADNIRATIQFGGNLIAIGRRGCGKTQIIKETIAASDFKEVYLNLSTIERPDLGGYPDFFANKNKENLHRYVEYLFPVFYKELIEGDKKSVVLFDEADKADPSVFAPLLEFTQFHSINGTGMKNLQAIMMTGNLQAEGGTRPPLPLLDRAEKYLIEILPKHWIDWGAETGQVHPTVAAFISDNHSELYGEVDPGDVYADPSPRGWHNGSKILFFGEKHDWHPDMLLHKVAGCIGKSAGIKYAAFFKHYQFLLPFVDKIIKGENVKEFKDFENTKKIVICMTVCNRFARLLDKHIKSSSSISSSKDDQTISDNIAKFLAKVDPEINFIAIRGQIGAKRFLDSNLLADKQWDRLCDQFIQKIK